MRELLDKRTLSLRHQQDYMKEIALKHYDHLPENRFSANPF